MVSERTRRCPARSGDRAPTPGRRLRAPTVHAAVENLTPPSAGEDASSRNLRSPAGGRMERRGALGVAEWNAGGLWGTVRSCL